MPTDVRRPVSVMLDYGQSYQCLTTLVLIMLPVIVIPMFEIHRPVHHHRG